MDICLNKSKLSKELSIPEKFILLSGRKCRQKARKLAKLNLYDVIYVFSKKEEFQYVVYYDENHNCFSWIYNDKIVFKDGNIVERYK